MIGPLLSWVCVRGHEKWLEERIGYDEVDEPGERS